MEVTEESVFMKRRIVKRRMEAQGQGGGCGEVRRLHIIYFLSRKGRVDHPHLIRVHHLSRNGVHLRDVKRWLSELRGNDISETFAWSYKRKYKTGYVWQDLLDEDLITPISDNEYVLKGSEIVSSSCDVCPYGEKKVSSMQKEPPSLEMESNIYKFSSKQAFEGHPETKMDVSTYTSCEIEEESPFFSSETTSTMTDKSVKLEEEKKLLDTAKQPPLDQLNKFDNPLYTKNKKKSNNNHNNNNSDGNKEKMSSTPRSSFSTTFTKSKSYSSGASNMFRNLITCGGVDTKDSVMVMMKRRGKSSSNAANNSPSNDTAEICRGDKMGGSQRTFGTSLNQQHNGARKSFDGEKGSKKNMDNKNEFSNKKPVSAAYKPVNGPNCSQCGKTFKPEKMYIHMKSCKGIKYSLAKATAEKIQSHGSMVTSHQESVAGYFLTN